MPGTEFKFHGLKEAEELFVKAEAKAPHVVAAALLELGLFGERETKLGTRVDTGTARASIGHFTPSDMTGKGTAKDAAAASSAAHFEEPTPNNLEVSWGSRLVYVPIINYKYGDMMFEKGLQSAISFAPILLGQYLPDIFE